MWVSKVIPERTNWQNEEHVNWRTKQHYLNTCPTPHMRRGPPRLEGWLVKDHHCTSILNKTYDIETTNVSMRRNPVLYRLEFDGLSAKHMLSTTNVLSV